jgi:DNA-binding FadR family transcriptional regulator
MRGRGGGTFVADVLPAADPPSQALLATWREICDQRLAVELGVAVLAAERAREEAIGPLDELVRVMEGCLDDFPAYRRADVRFHVALAEATGSPRLISAMTEAQGAMSDLIHHIQHPPEVLAWANAQHARLIACLERHDAPTAVRVMTEHLQGTEHVLAGLLPHPA